MKLHTQNQLYTSISFWDIRISKLSLGMPDHTHLNLHNQFTTLIDMKLHAQNQLYSSFSFWDFKVLMICLSMPGHTWPRPPKITLSICSFNTRYVPAFKKSTLYLQEFLRYQSLKILQSDWQSDWSEIWQFSWFLNLFCQHLHLLFLKLHQEIIKVAPYADNSSIINCN